MIFQLYFIYRVTRQNHRTKNLCEMKKEVYKNISNLEILLVFNFFSLPLNICSCIFNNKPMYLSNNGLISYNWIALRNIYLQVYNFNITYIGLLIDKLRHVNSFISFNS